VLDSIQSLRQDLAGFLSHETEAPATSGETEASIEASESAVAGMPSTAIVDAFIKNLHIEVLPRSNVIQVSFKSSRRLTAACCRPP
jgi:hypothetical protein